MPVRRLDAPQPGAVADRDAEEPAVPGEILGPICPRDALDRGIGGFAVTGLVPRLEAQRRNAVFGSRQGLWRAQYIHPRRIKPDAGPCLVLGHVDYRDLAYPGAAQSKGKGAAALPAANDHDVVVDPGPVRDPVLRVGSDQSERLAGIGVRIVHPAHSLSESGSKLVSGESCVGAPPNLS